MKLAQEFVRGAAHSLLRNIAYYDKRKAGRGGGTGTCRGSGL